MPLQKQSVNLNFGQGLDLKTDPWQVPVGKMEELVNVVFNKTKRYDKRSGFTKLESLPDASSTGISTFNGNLVATGSNLNVLSTSVNEWFTKGILEPVQIETSNILRNSRSQVSCDVAVSSSGLACSVYLDSSSNAYYQINDSNTGQIIVSETALPATAAIPRVFLLGSYFIVTFLATVTAASHLRYIAIPIYNVTVPGSATSVATNVSSLTAAYDGVVANNNLYFGYNANDGGGAVRFTFINAQLTQGGVLVRATYVANRITMYADVSTFPTPVIWASWYRSSNGKVFASAYNQIQVSILAPTELLTGLTLNNITSTATAGILKLFYETVNTYSYSSVATDFIKSITCTQAGVVGTVTAVSRSVGLAAKAFYLDSTAKSYLITAYSGSYQPTYFVMDQSGNLIAKLAYSNGAGYPSTQILPQVNIDGDTFKFGYLIKELVVPVNKDQGVTTVAGIYSYAGINLAEMTINRSEVSVCEIGGSIHLTGGFLWLYDGVIPVEFGFHVWPEDILVTTAATSVTPTGDTTNGSTTILNLSAMTNVRAGCKITGTGIPANTIIISVGASSIVISQAATASNTGTTLTITGNIAASKQYYYYATYEWTDAAGNIHRSAPSAPFPITTGGSLATNTIQVPTLRLTYKNIANPVRIVLYRWSEDQQVAYQVTPIASATLNDKTVDSVTFVDTYADSSILGNIILYTTGGVLENIAPPACSALSLYKSRLFLIPSENRDTLWFSKQVVQSTPVEMSDLLTLFTAPTTSSQASTGPNFCIVPMDDKNIISKANALYYFTGTGPDNTGANNDFSEPEFITSVTGSIDQESFVLSPFGLMFGSSGKGIWVLKRDLTTDYIGAEVDDFNSSTITSAVNIPGTNQIRFTLDSSRALVYDYYYNQWGTFNNLAAISSVIYQDKHTYLDDFGNVYQETAGSYVDGSRPVLLSLKTGWINLAGLQGYQRAYYFYIIGEYLSPHKITIEISYDYEPHFSQIETFTPDNFNLRYGQDALYGSTSPFGGNGILEQWRIFFKRQKCQAFQIKLTESYDASYGVAPGAGLNISGFNMVIGVKSGYPRIKPTRSV